MMMDACLQDVLFDGINRTDDICAKNPGFDELEIIRTGTGVSLGPWTCMRLPDAQLSGKGKSCQISAV